MKKLFILGCPRSGTTMLQQALNRHSQIVIPPETKFFYYFYGRSKSCQSAHLRRINEDLQIDVAQPARRVRTPGEAAEFYNLLGRRYLQRLDRQGICYFGDKTPEHTGHVATIRRVFPQAKFVLLYRDGRDVAVSLSKMPWIRASVNVGFVIWIYYYRWLTGCLLDRSLNVYPVRYEDIVADPAAQLEGVLRFLEVPYEPDVAEGCGNSEGIPAREYPWKARALQKIASNRIGVWKSELAEAQVRDLERLGGRALESLGYPTGSSDNGRPSVRLLLQLSLELTRFGYHLPARCLWKELPAVLSGMVTGLAPGRNVHSRTPAATQQRRGKGGCLAASDNSRFY